MSEAIVLETINQNAQSDRESKVQPIEVEISVSTDWEERLKEVFQKIIQEVGDVENKTVKIESIKDFINKDENKDKQIEGLYLTYPQLLELAEQADKNNDKTIEENEFLRIAKEGNSCKERLETTFKKLCGNKHETIDLQKLKKNLKRVSKIQLDDLDPDPNATLPVFDEQLLKCSDFEDMLDKADINGDGKISKDEFLNLTFSMVLVKMQEPKQLWTSLKIIAYAEIYELRPPKFILLLTLLHIILYYCDTIAHDIVEKLKFR